MIQAGKTDHLRRRGGSPPGCSEHSVSVVVSDDFNVQSRRILNLHEIKNYIIYASGNRKRSVASSDPAL